MPAGLAVTRVVGCQAGNQPDDSCEVNQVEGCRPAWVQILIRPPNGGRGYGERRIHRMAANLGY
jgi:hypothetical protein